MKMAGGPTSINLKLTLLIIAFFIAGGTYYYTQNLVAKLQDREKNIVKLYAESLEYIANSVEASADYTFVFDIIQRIDFPLVLTDENDMVSFQNMKQGIRNIEIDSTLSSQEQQTLISEKILELKEINDPISVTLEDTIVVQKIYFGDSDIVTQLKYYPYLQIISAIFFIIIAYISFSYMKKTEQSNIWVGMSRETAHQLGTPISSLMGWAELLTINYKNEDKVLDISEEMGSDLNRLNKIAKRFSKIGSLPELKKHNVYALVSKVIEYFQRRIPQFGKKVQLTLSGERSATALLNPELFEWVIENLIKNGLDAIDKEKEGIIKISIQPKNGHIEINVSDNGKGIDLKHRKDVFRPGYSTKTRGWGLGLSLSRRIVSDYHKGKIFVLKSELNVGTTFQIIIKST